MCGDYVGQKEKRYRGALGANEANTDRVVVVLITLVTVFSERTLTESEFICIQASFLLFICHTYLIYSLLFAFVTLTSDPPGLRSFTVTYESYTSEMSP